MEKKQDSHQQEIPDSVYQQAKDWAYNVASINPSLVKAMASVESNAPVMQAIREGKETFDREQRMREPMPDWLKPDQVKTHFNEKSFEHGKDKDEDRER